MSDQPTPGDSSQPESTPALPNEQSAHTESATIASDAVGSDRVGPDASTPDAAEPDCVGPDASAPDAVASDRVGPDAPAPDAVASGTDDALTSAAESTPSAQVSPNESEAEAHSDTEDPAPASTPAVDAATIETASIKGAESGEPRRVTRRYRRRSAGADSSTSADQSMPFSKSPVAPTGHDLRTSAESDSVPAAHASVEGSAASSTERMPDTPDAKPEAAARTESDAPEIVPQAPGSLSSASGETSPSAVGTSSSASDLTVVASVSSASAPPSGPNPWEAASAWSVSAPPSALNPSPSAWPPVPPMRPVPPGSRSDMPTHSVSLLPRWRRVACPPGVLPAAGIAGLAGAALIPLDRPGIGWVLAGSVATLAVFTVDRRARRAAAAGAGGGTPGTAHSSESGELSLPAADGAERDAGRSASAMTGTGVGFGVLQGNWGRVWWVALALVLLGVGTVRGAGWLFALCVVGAGVAGSLAVVGRRSVYGAWYDVIAVPIESISAIPWVYSAFGRIGDGTARRSWRAGMSVAVTLALLAVFAPLLGGADATFAKLLSAVTPQVDAESVMRWIFTFVALGFGSVGAMYLLAGPRAEATGESRGGSLRRLEWALPVGALTVLFAVFVIAQFVALFGGDDYVQRNANLTYAEYARSGFWQLSIVTVLTLAVIAVVLRWAARDSAADRAWLRILLCAISVLSLIIVASALGRMWTYQQAYGFTVMRLLVEVCELWLGLVYLLMIAAALRLDGSWVPRAAIGTAMATLFFLSVLNPEGIVAERNIDRWEHGKNLDTAYLSRLSPDVVPAVERLPEPQRSAVLDAIRLRLEEDTWQGWNLSRANAR